MDPGGTLSLPLLTERYSHFGARREKTKQLNHKVAHKSLSKANLLVLQGLALTSSTPGGWYRTSGHPPVLQIVFLEL